MITEEKKCYLHSVPQLVKNSRAFNAMVLEVDLNQKSVQKAFMVMASSFIYHASFDDVKARYLLRPSSNKNSDLILQVFSMTFGFDPLQSYHGRFAYNTVTKKWQVAKKKKKGVLVYDLDSTGVFLSSNMRENYLYSRIFCEYQSKITLHKNGNILNQFHSLHDLITLNLIKFAYEKKKILLELNEILPITD